MSRMNRRDPVGRERHMDPFQTLRNSARDRVGRHRVGSTGKVGAVLLDASERDHGERPAADCVGHLLARHVVDRKAHRGAPRGEATEFTGSWPRRRRAASYAALVRTSASDSSEYQAMWGEKITRSSTAAKARTSGGSFAKTSRAAIAGRPLRRPSISAS